MKNATFLCAALFLASGCKLGITSGDEDLGKCWPGVQKEGDGNLVLDTKLIYLRGSTVVVPSETCHGSRLQTVEISKAALGKLRELEFRDLSIPLGVDAKISFHVQKRVGRVVEIDLKEIARYSKLSRESSLQLERLLRN